MSESRDMKVRRAFVRALVAMVMAATALPNLLGAGLIASLIAAVILLALQGWWFLLGIIPLATFAACGVGLMRMDRSEGW